MSQTLLFRFVDPERVQWRSVDPRHPDSRQASETGRFTDLAARAAGKRLVLVAPGEAVLLTRAQAPGRNRSTWLKALPYALEDSLAEDVETLHFAVGRRTADGRVPVAVVRRTDLEYWLETCAQAGLTPAAVVPAPLLLPLTEQAWSIAALEDPVLVRSGEHSGFATDAGTLNLLLELALAEAGEACPARLRVWGDPVLEGVAAGLERIPEPLPPDLPALLASGLRWDSLLNLLQGPYSRRAQLGKWLRPWRAAAALALLWLGLQLGFQGAEFLALQRQQQALREEMTHIYRQAVPGATRVVNPRVQLANRLAELRGNRDPGEAGFLELLYRGGQTLTAFEGISLRGLRYDDQRLNLDLEGDSLEVLDTFKQRLAEQPDLEARMRTSKRDDRIQSQVVLQSGDS